jgi:hypothetical protein
MGTRGVTGFIIGEQEKISYNHFDSYPDGLGLATLRFLNRFFEGDTIEGLREKAEAIELVSNDKPPTPEQVGELSKYSDLKVSERSEQDWYCLLRHTQGEWQAILDAGYIEDAHHFPEDSLFCEWGYIINVDERTLECYRGFQTEKHDKGRFAGRNDNPYTSGNVAGRPTTYYEIALVETFPLDDLPNEVEFVELLEGSVSDGEGG